MSNGNCLPSIPIKFVALGILGVIVIQLGALWKVHDQVARAKPDFAGFYAAGKAVLQGDGDRVYDIQQQRKQSQLLAVSGRDNPLIFVHPPYELVLFALLALLPYSAAFALWYACNLTMLIATVWILRPIVPHLALRTHWILLLASGFAPILAATIHGQDSLLFMLLMAIAIRSLQQRQERAAGWCVALGTFKIQLVIPIAIVLLVSRNWRAIRGLLEAGVALAAASLLLVGVHGFLQYPMLLYHFDQLPSSASAVHVEYMSTLRGFLVSMFGSVMPGNVLKTISVFVWITGVVLFARASLLNSGEMRNLRFALLLAGPAVISYYLYLHDFSFLLIPLLLVADYLIGAGLKSLSLTRKLLATFAVLLFICPKLQPSPRASQLVFVVLVVFISLLGIEIHVASEHSKDSGFACNSQAAIREC